MLLGEEFSARQAVDWGVAHRLVPSNQLDEISIAACQRLAALDTTVIAHYTHQSVIKATFTEPTARLVVS